MVTFTEAKGVAMNRMFLLIFLLFISSCTSSELDENAISLASLKAKNKIYNMKLSGYVEKMSHELISNIAYVKPESVIAVVSFVYLDSDYFSTPIFAEQIRESFTYEIHKMGQPVVEYQATGFIRVTESGSFALSKDFKELSPNLPIDYVLAGTLSNMTDGVLVNAKLIGIESLSVVAAAQKEIPRYVVNRFIPSDEKKEETEMLIKGLNIELINR